MRTIAPKMIEVNKIIGVGGSISATKLLATVKVLEVKLQMPIAVEQNATGKTSCVLTYTTVKPPETPNIAIITKVAIIIALTSVPMKRIARPPTTEIVKISVKVHFIPILL